MLVLPGRTASWNVAAGGFSDNFNRADETLTDGANWTRFQALGAGASYTVTTNAAQLTASGAGERVRTTTLLSGTAYAEVELISTTTAGSTFHGPLLYDLTATDNYEFIFEGGLRLRRVVSGTTTQIGSTFTYTWANNDVLRIEREIISGSEVEVRGLLNGSAVITFSDTTADRVSGDVYPGLFGYVNSAHTGRIDNFASGNV